MQNLTAGFVVGPTLPSGHFWGLADISSRYLLSTYRLHSSQTATMGSAPVDFFAGIDGFVGFRFTGDDGMHYGWARINIDLDAAEVTVRDWAFESTADASVTVGSVPEPSTCTLALFAAGAAGVALWRRRRTNEPTTPGGSP
jgi:MYXO-CTERM domain-containing protein